MSEWIKVELDGGKEGDHLTAKVIPDWLDYFKGPFLWENEHLYDANDKSLCGDLAWYHVDDQVENDDGETANQVFSQIGQVLVKALNDAWERRVLRDKQSACTHDVSMNGLGTITCTKCNLYFETWADVPRNAK